MMVKAVGSVALVSLGAWCGALTTSCSEPSDAEPRPDAGDADAADFPEEAADAGSGARFHDLYRDLFGPTGVASCAGDGTCHGSTSTAGSLASGGYVCADEDGCHDRMTSVLVGDGGAAAPDATRLYRVLRHRRTDGSIVGSMPRRPGYVFSRASMARVATWISNGAPKD